MTLIGFLVLFSVSLIAIGFLVDWMYKRRGIVTDPQENEKYVNTSERVYVESMLHQIKDQNNHPNH